jgi:uncharacterized protein involved in exopolysaccharide biosynthesis
VARNPGTGESGFYETRDFKLTSRTELQGSEAIVDGGLLATVLWARRSLIVAFAIVGTGAFAALAFLSPPVYRASAVLVPASPDRNALGGSISSALGSMGGLASLAGIDLSAGNSAIEETLAVLQSREFTQVFIADHNLMPELYADIWDSASKTWKVSPKKQPTPAKAFRVFDKIRTIRKSEKTGLITLQIDWRDRVEAAAWVNALVAALNTEMRTRAIEQSDASLGYLQKELAATSDIGTREAVNRLIEGQIKQRMLANVTQEYSLRFVDKALVADADDPVGPKKILLMVIGLFLGLAGGISLAFMLSARKLASRRRG